MHQVFELSPLMMTVLCVRCRTWQSITHVYGGLQQFCSVSSVHLPPGQWAHKGAITHSPLQEWCDG
jgi:hypothetical protein